MTFPHISSWEVTPEVKTFPPAKFIDLVSDASSVDAWWMDGEGQDHFDREMWGVLVHEGIAYTVNLGVDGTLVGVARVSAELWEAE